MKSLLTKIAPNEYVFNPNKENSTVWITVKNVSVYIVPQKDGVKVALFRFSEEADNPIVEAFAPS